MDTLTYDIRRRVWAVCGRVGRQRKLASPNHARDRIAKDTQKTSSSPISTESCIEGHEDIDRSVDLALEAYSNEFVEPVSGAETLALAEQSEPTENYIRFSGEDETDYTAGPIRFVNASDGFQDCAALLMNLDLSAKIQRVIQRGRHFTKAKRVASREREVCSSLEVKVRREITHHQSRLATLAAHPDDKQPSEQPYLEEELENLEVLLDDVKARRRIIDCRIQTYGTGLLELQAGMNAYLEEAFVAAELLDPEESRPDTPIEELDLQTEYQDLCRKMRIENGLDDDVTIAPLDTTREQYVRPELTPEQQEEQALRQAYWDATDSLKEAQRAFDRREADREEALQANIDAADRGEEPEDISPDLFDVKWVQRFQVLTGDLISAEQAFELAKEAAASAGVVIADDQTSDIMDHEDDGYRTSFEQERAESAPKPVIDGWLTSLQDAVSPTFNEHPAEGDEWKAEDVDVSDSVSMVAEGTDRKRIDKWREVCGV